MGKSEYIFRVKEYDDINNEENPYKEGWVYSYVRGDHDFFYGMSDGQYDSDTLGMCSLLTDAKGKLIYAGDVICIHDLVLVGKTYTGVVEFRKGGFFIYYNDEGKPYKTNLQYHSTALIVGNIYEGEYKKFKYVIV